MDWSDLSFFIEYRLVVTGVIFVFALVLGYIVVTAGLFVEYVIRKGGPHVLFGQILGLFAIAR